MTFVELMYFMLSMVKASSQNALERFFSTVKGDVSMTQQAFSLARQKIHWEAFREVFEGSVEGSYNEALKEWRGYFLMAIDGSRVALPREEGLRRYYGAMGEGLKAPTAQHQAGFLRDDDGVEHAGERAAHSE